MAFGFGIGDVVAAINALVTTCDKIAKVPKEMREAARDSQSLLVVIRRIGEETADKSSIVHKEQMMKEQLKLDMSEVKLDVKRLKRHLHVYDKQEERPPLHRATQRILFALYTIPEIKEIRAKFAEYGNRLGLMLKVLSITGHNEVLRTVREHHEILNEIKASFAESEKRRKEKDALKQERAEEREEMYRKWESINLKHISPEDAAALRVFLEQKQQKIEEATSESTEEDVARRHVDEISTRLWDAQPPVYSPRAEIPSIQLNTESWVASVSSSARHGRRNHCSTIVREGSHPGGLREPETPPSREELLSHMSNSRSSASSQSSHRRHRDSTHGSSSTVVSTSRRRSLLDRIQPWFQPSPSVSSRRSSRVHSTAHSSVGTPRRRVNSDVGADIPALSLDDPNDSNEWKTVSARPHPVRSNTGLSSSPTRRRPHQSPTLPRGLSSNIQRPTNILCVNWDNNSFSRIAQTYFELLRLWTINTSSLWPFDRVESSGICMSDSTDIDPDTVMNLLAPPRSNFRSRDFPNEKEKLFHRMQYKSPSEFKKQYLDLFGYIICFDQKSYEVVCGKNSGRQQETTTSDSQVRCIQLELDHLAGKKLNDDEAMTAATKIKIVVEAFMQQRFGWKYPDRKLVEGERRTLQIPIDRRKKGTIIGTRGTNIRELREKSKCAVQIFDEGLEVVCSLVIATGQVEDLMWVEKRVKDMLAPRHYWG